MNQAVKYTKLIIHRNQTLQDKKTLASYRLKEGDSLVLRVSSLLAVTPRGTPRRKWDIQRVGKVFVYIGKT